MNALLQSVEKSVQTRRLLRAGQRLLVAVSGGLDSMVLVDLLHRLAATHRWRLVIAHFNHQLRAAASDADERLVRSAARRLGLPLACGAWPRSDHGVAKQFGLEMAARLARHQFLAEQARAFKASAIALAHHADDQAELFFLRLLRGAGGEGLSGMKWQNPSPADAQLQLIRPLLDLQKIELAAYAKERKIRFRIDASNRDERHDRNWLRATLLPALTRRFGAASLNSIRRAMALVGGDADFVRSVAEAWHSGRKPFDALHPAVQRQVVRRELKRLGLPSTFDLIEQLRQSPGQPITAAPGIALRRDALGSITRCETGLESFRDQTTTVDLSGSGHCSFGAVSFDWSRRRSAGLPRRPAAGASRADLEWFDAALIGATIRLRHWRPGDRFQPIGMKSSAKLQDLFTNLKISRALRRELVVAETECGEIFWVEGLRISERFKVSRRTQIRLRWAWQRKPTQTRPA